MSRVELFGILNVTPDSFSDGDLYFDPTKAVAHANSLFDMGANYVDVGAESTRPGADQLTPDQEWQRLKPVLSDLLYAYPDHISLDTYHPETVRRAARDLGSFIINDVTTFNNPEMIEVAAQLHLRCIVSHLPEAYGQDIQEAHRDKPIDSLEQVQEELLTKRTKMISAGINADKIILDPGIGFGKTPELNWELLEFAKYVPDVPVMVGYSRKRFLGVNRMDPEPNLDAARTAIAAGTRYLRVHDVAAHRQLLNQL
jgi:dihydropteroate synthase